MSECECRVEGGYEIIEPHFHSQQPTHIVHCSRHSEARVASLEAQVTALREALRTLVLAISYGFDGTRKSLCLPTSSQVEDMVYAALQEPTVFRWRDCTP